MNKKEKNLLFLLLACAFLLVVILYSPIGSPESYVQNAYYSENQGVNFYGKIQNSTKRMSFSDDNSASPFNSPNSISTNISFPNGTSLSIDENSINVPTPEYKSINNTNKSRYTVANVSRYLNSTSTLNSNTNYSVDLQHNNIVSSNQNNTGGSIGSGVGAVGAVIIGKTTNNDNSTPQLNGFIALNDIDLSVFSDITTKQGNGYTPGSGATDPGEDPNAQSEPIPVPDGFWLLLMMAGGYTAIKYFKKKYQTV